MATKKIITVFGATGAQGGSLAKAILSDPNGEFAARAVTRNVNSDKAKELGKLGAEVVAADVDHPDSVQKALEGAYGAYFVTFFWDHFSPEKEIEQAKIFATAAKKAGIKRLCVYSGGPQGEAVSSDLMTLFQGDPSILEAVAITNRVEAFREAEIQKKECDLLLDSSFTHIPAKSGGGFIEASRHGSAGIYSFVPSPIVFKSYAMAGSAKRPGAK